MRSIWFALAIGLAAWAQSLQVQQPRPIQKPKGSWQAPAKLQKPREIQKIKDQCRTRLLVGADTLFESGKAELAPGAEKALSDLGPMIRKEGTHPVSVEGHTDALGSAGSNRELSERRARIVESWLETRGYVSAGLASVAGYGGAKPVAPNSKPDGSDNPEGRRKNRRVEIVINTCQS